MPRVINGVRGPTVAVTIGTRNPVHRHFRHSGAFADGACHPTPGMNTRPAAEGALGDRLVQNPVTLPSALSTGGQLGHLKRADLPPLRHLREIQAKNPELKAGDRLLVNIFAVGDRVDVIGTSKGKGFQGAVKRHHFRGGPQTHGQSDRLRAPGAHSAGTTPGRVLKGSRSPGHMGHQRITSQNLKVILVDAERNLIGVRGAVPGPKGGLVIVKKARKAW